MVKVYIFLAILAGYIPVFCLEIGVLLLKWQIIIRRVYLNGNDI